MKRKSDRKKFVSIIAPLAIVLSIILGLKYLSVKFKKEDTQMVDTTEEMVEENISNVNLEGELPGDFPSQFPIFKEAEIDESWEAKTEDAYAMSVVWRVEANPEEVFNFYEEELTLAGYKISVLSSESDSYTVSFSNSYETGFIGIVEDGKDILISATIGNIGI